MTYEAGYPEHCVYSNYRAAAHLPCSIMAYVNNDPVDRILTAIIVILAIVIAISLLLKITGHSPENIQILYSLVIMITISSFKLHYDTGGFKEFSRHTKDSFQNIKIDMREIQRTLEHQRHEIQEKLEQQQEQLRNIAILLQGRKRK